MERLEKTKKILNHLKGYDIYEGNDDIEVLEWLIETIEKQQAEIDTLSMAHDEMHRLVKKDKHALIKSNIALNKRVQELEEANERLQSKNIATNSKLFYLEKQNKRYREALEAIAYFDDKEEGEVATRIDVKYIARKALEGEE